VSGDDGIDGSHGHSGAAGATNGAHGDPGQHAYVPTMGQQGGRVRLVLSDGGDGMVSLSGELANPSDTVTQIRTAAYVGEQGSITVSAFGGRGGRGGNGGNGGDGAVGHAGADATRFASGRDGGPGGDGGNAGSATSGANGGAGGAITIVVSEDDTPLLMLLEHDVHGGAGGHAGTNGVGGHGGEGGSGGDSYSWTETDSYTDSHGDRQSTTSSHFNAGGSRGRAGRNGAHGQADVARGVDGCEGSLTIEVSGGSDVASYASRYDLRLRYFVHEGLNVDDVYEPGECVRVASVQVENVGGMPTPAKDELRLGLVPGPWVEPDATELVCIPGIIPGQLVHVDGELGFRITDFTPVEPGEPLAVTTAIDHRAWLPSVRRDFRDYYNSEHGVLGWMLVQFPAFASAVTNLRSLATGETTRVKFTVTNRCRLALGSQSPGGRTLRVRVTTAPETELGDDAVVFTADGSDIAPTVGWHHKIELLDAGATVALELELTIKDGAAAYHRYAGVVVLELGPLDAPDRPRPIHLRAFDVRVARRFVPDDADVLLVVNHRTTRDELAAWEGMAARLMARLAVWDLSRGRHLDLERPLDDGKSLADWFAGKAMVVLDNEIDGPDGRVHPHAFLCSDQALCVGAAGLDIAFIGRGPAMRELLIPGANARAMSIAPALVEDAAAAVKALREVPRTLTPVYRRYWLRRWKRPSGDWLERQALRLSRHLRDALPAERHLVVHRFTPELTSSSVWGKKWRVGTLETMRTLDATAGSIVHAAVDDATVHDAGYVRSAAATVAILAMFDFGEQLERLRWTLANPGAEAHVIDQIADSLLVDLANELAVVAAPAGPPLRDLERSMPRLRAFTYGSGTAEIGSTAGASMIRLIGRLQFVARNHVTWFERVPPLRWLRRAPRIQAHVEQAIDTLLASMFGPGNLSVTREATLSIAQALATTTFRWDWWFENRRAGSLKLARAPLDAPGLTSDVELFEPPSERVVSGDELDTIAAAKAAATKRREELVAAGDLEHAELTSRH